MSSYSKIIRAFISSIVGFSLVSSPSIAMNSNFNRVDLDDVQNNINPDEVQINPLYLFNLLSSTHHALENVNNMTLTGDQYAQEVINYIFDSLNNVDDQILEECFSEDNDDSLLENIEGIITELRYAEGSAYNLCNYFYNYNQDICYTLYQIYCRLYYIDSWISYHITSEINNIPNELTPNLSEEEFYNRYAVTLNYALNFNLYLYWSE